MCFLKKVMPVLLFAASTQAVAFGMDDVEPYVGIDFQNRHMDFHKNDGSQFFKKNSLQGDLFLGVKLHENFGVELGYEQSQRKKRNTSFSVGDANLGGATFGQPATYASQTKIQGFHLDAVGFMPIDSVAKDVTLFAKVGIAKLKAKIKRELTSVGGNPTSITSLFNQKDNKFVLRLAAGAQYLITPNVGVRGSVGFEKTSNLKPYTVLDNGETRTVKLKNSFIYGLGVFYKF